MGGSPLGSRRCDEPEFNLREWHLKARISRENTGSRRFSASYIRSFREDTRSFRSHFTISSTASSPGYHLKDEIDPSTYSFNTALKALQARSGYVWECLSPEGFALNSKWNEAEKYICNPLSGEVPMECLSAKTLSGRSFRNMIASRITMSAPLVYSQRFDMNHHCSSTPKKEEKTQFPPQEKQQMVSRTRDVGTQSTPHEESSGSSSPTSTPSIHESTLQLCEEENGDHASNSGAKINSVEQVRSLKWGRKESKPDRGEFVQKSMQVGQVKEIEEEEEEDAERRKEEKQKTGKLCRCRQGGCLLSWGSLWLKKRMRDKHKPAS